MYHATFNWSTPVILTKHVKLRLSADYHKISIRLQKIGLCVQALYNYMTHFGQKYNSNKKTNITSLTLKDVSGDLEVVIRTCPAVI